jgi:hypothetical protein
MIISKTLSRSLYKAPSPSQATVSPTSLPLHLLYTSSDQRATGVAGFQATAVVSASAR